MKILNLLLISLLVLLSIAAGFAKILLVEQEVKFLQSFGFNELMIIAFGLVQICAGTLLIAHKTRLFGALLAILSFLFSTILLFFSGDILFALVSIIPIVLASFLYNQTANVKRQVVT